jgi:isoleucyl-tRNA synthetase
MAPAMPFYAEYLWQAVKEDDDAESVHLAAWPTGGTVDEDILENMAQTRAVVTAALEARTKAGLKVRQPIAAVTGPVAPEALQAVILDELNAKSYTVAEGEEVAIDATLTPELLAEGAVRELMRAVQGRRKAEGLAPEDVIELTVQTDQVGQSAIAVNQDLLTKTVGASAVEYADTEGEEVQAGEFTFIFSIEKQ